MVVQLVTFGICMGLVSEAYGVDNANDGMTGYAYHLSRVREQAREEVEQGLAWSGIGRTGTQKGLYVWGGVGAPHEGAYRELVCSLAWTSPEVVEKELRAALRDGVTLDEVYEDVFWAVRALRNAFALFPNDPYAQEVLATLNEYEWDEARLGAVR